MQVLEYQERQRVMVRWERWRAGEQNTYAGRVVEVRGEIRGRGQYVQTEALILYEHISWKLWHKLSELSPLDETAHVPAPRLQEDDDDDDENDCSVAENAWLELSLRCCYSLAPLTDPAR